MRWIDDMTGFSSFTGIRQETLFQPFLSGREITVAAVGGAVIATLDVGYDGQTFDRECKRELRAVYRPLSGGKSYPELPSWIAALSAAFGLDCFWRSDFREQNGTMHLLDINALPGLAAPPGGMVEAILEASGWDYLALLGLRRQRPES